MECNKCGLKRNPGKTLRKVITDGDLVSHICKFCDKKLSRWTAKLVHKVGGVKAYRAAYRSKHFTF